MLDIYDGIERLTKDDSAGVRKPIVSGHPGNGNWAEDVSTERYQVRQYTKFIALAMR